MNIYMAILTHYKASVPLGGIIRAFSLPIFQGCSVEGKRICILQTCKDSHAHNEDHQYVLTYIAQLQGLSVRCKDQIFTARHVVLLHQCHTICVHVYAHGPSHVGLTFAWDAYFPLHLFLFCHTVVFASGQVAEISSRHLSAQARCDLLSTELHVYLPRKCIWAGRRRCRRCRGACGCSSGGNGCSWNTRSVREWRGIIFKAIGAVLSSAKGRNLFHHKDFQNT